MFRNHVDTMRSILLLLASSSASALQLATLMADHMVLPREPKRATVWGKAQPHSKVKVTLDIGSGKTYSGAAGADGSWLIELAPEPAMTGKSLTVEGDGESKTLHDVAFGDVWVCSGQSNMRFQLKGAFEFDEVIASALQFPDLRIVQLRPAQCGQPQWNIHTDKVKDANCTVESGDFYLWSPPATEPGKFRLPGMSAVCYNFGTTMYKALDGKVPIGLVAGFRDMTEIEQFMSPEALADETCGGLGAVPKTSQLMARKSTSTDFAGWEATVGFEKTHSLCFNAFINPILNLRPAGMVWYQGEANRMDRDRYACWFPAMIADLRLKFKVPDMDFEFVQLAATRDSTDSFTKMRAVQMRALELPHVGYAVAIDQGDLTSPSSSLHPRRKAEVGRRLGLRALNMHYGFSETGLGPIAKEVVRDGAGAVRVSFEHGSAEGLHVADAPDCKIIGKGACCKESPFEAQVKGEWQKIEDWKIDGVNVLLRGVESSATCVRFDWNTYPQCVMLNGKGGPDDHAGIAATPFVMDIKGVGATSLRGVRRHS